MDSVTNELLNLAKNNLKNAYVPYSNFPVSAALKTQSGKIFAGVNVENSSYGLTNCAERSCLFNYVTGTGGSDPIVEMVVMGKTPGPISPCGACRQVMSEFLLPDTPVVLSNNEFKTHETNVSKMLPGFFSEEDLKNYE